MKIKELLSDDPNRHIQSIAPTETIGKTAQTLLNLGIGALVVMDQDRQLHGIVSERDLVQIVASFDPEAVKRPISDIMTKNVITCSSNDEVGFVLRLMNTNAIRHIPIIENGQLIDMISIRELTKAYEVLQVEANIDPLTELSNRRPFLKTMATEFERSRRTGSPLSIAMIDLDHFKKVNDTYGHDAGDKVLRAISDILILEFRSIDLIGRLGGEEFAVVFPETDLAGAQVACDRLRRVIERTVIPIDGGEIKVTASIGIAAVTEATPCETTVLKDADKVLYAAKTSGRNCVMAFAA